MRNPGMAFRVMWLDRADRGRAMGGGAAADGGTGCSTANRGQALFNTASLIVAVVGTVAGVLALFVSK